jgi:hypothetical protein
VKLESSQVLKLLPFLWKSILWLNAKNTPLHLPILLQLSAAFYSAQMPENPLPASVKQHAYRFATQQLFSTSSPTQQQQKRG